MTATTLRLPSLAVSHNLSSMTIPQLQLPRSWEMASASAPGPSPSYNPIILKHYDEMIQKVDNERLNRIVEIYENLYQQPRDSFLNKTFVK